MTLTYIFLRFFRSSGRERIEIISPQAFLGKDWANGIFFVSRSGRILAFAHVAQLAEHVLGKDEVISSILIMGSSFDGELINEN